jgi:hypothetical protein
MESVVTPVGPEGPVGFGERSAQSVFSLGRVEVCGGGRNHGGGGYRGIFVYAGVTRLGPCASLTKLSAIIQSYSCFEGVVKLLSTAFAVGR